MKVQLDLARIAQLPSAEREAQVTDALRTGQITAAQAAELSQGRAPSPDEQKSVGANAYGGSSGQATAARPLPRNAAVYGAHMARQLAEGPENRAKAREAQPQIDRMLDALGRAGPDNQKALLKKLNDFLGQLGPDVVDHLAGPTPEASGVGYVNARLQAMGAGVSLEPIMDAATRYFVKAARPGEVRGQRGSISFSFAPYSEPTLAFLRSKGVEDRGMWSVGFEGMEAWSFRENRDGSVSAKIRDLRRSVNGGDLREVLSDFTRIMGEQALPGGYTLEIDLERVPRELHAQVRQALGGLADLGAELEYLETDPKKLIDAAWDRVALEERIAKLLEKPQDQWNDADRREYEQVFALYHQQPDRRFEQP